MENFKLLRGTISCNVDGEELMLLLHVVAMLDKYRVVLEWCDIEGSPDELAAYRFVDVPLDTFQIADGLTDPMELCGVIPDGYEWRTPESDESVLCFPRSQLPEQSDDLI